MYICLSVCIYIYVYRKTKCHIRICDAELRHPLRLAAPSLEEAAAPLAAGKATCPPGVPRCTAVEGMVRVELA